MGLGDPAMIQDVISSTVTPNILLITEFQKEFKEKNRLILTSAPLGPWGPLGPGGPGGPCIKETIWYI